MRVSPKEDGELNKTPDVESRNNSEVSLSLLEHDEEDTDTLNIKPPQLQVKQKDNHYKSSRSGESVPTSSRYHRKDEKHYRSSRDAAKGRYLKGHLSSRESYRAVQYLEKYKDNLHSSHHSHSHRKKHKSVHEIRHRKHKYKDDTSGERSDMYFDDKRAESYALSRSSKRKRRKEHKHHREHGRIPEEVNDLHMHVEEAIVVEDNSSEDVDSFEDSDIPVSQSDLMEEEDEECQLRKNKLLMAEKQIREQREIAIIERKQRLLEKLKNIQYISDEELNESTEISDKSNNDAENDNSTTEENSGSDSEHNSVTFQSRNSSRESMPIKSVQNSPESNNLAFQNPDNPIYDTTENIISDVLVQEQIKKRKIDESLPPYYPAIQGCRSVEEFQCLNHIEEGTYGVVFRAKDKRDDEIVALKRLKMEREKEGFPITSLREINTLLKGQHSNIVTVREIVVGSNMDKIFIVMDYIEHDLKSLMETMKHKKQSFTIGETKCLMKQLLCAIAFLHDNWILHRDLKPSNLLLSHKGILKVGDFGLAREYGSPLKAYTPIVVTLWYRAPELLLCTKMYSTAIDVWSVGCIFAELLLMNPLFPGKSEVEQINRIFRLFGTPDEATWPGYKQLPAVKKVKFTDHPVPSNLRSRFRMLTQQGYQLLLQLLTYDPLQRVTAEDALQHFYFNETPLPIDPSMFPTWPAKSELGKRRALAASPKPPSGGREFKQLGNDDGFHIGTSETENRGLPEGGGFSLRF